MTITGCPFLLCWVKNFSAIIISLIYRIASAVFANLFGYCHEYFVVFLLTQFNAYLFL